MSGSDRSLSMFPNSLALIGSKVSTMGLGFLFWLLAARLFEVDEVGLAAGVVAAMMLCTQVALFGLGSAVIALLPTELRRPRALLDSAFSLVTVLALVTGVGFLFVSAVALGELHVVSGSVVYALLFVAATVTGALGILLDQLSTSLRRGDQALVRGLAFGITAVLSLAVLTAVGATGSQALLVPWVIAGATTLAIGLVQVRRALAGYVPRPTVIGSRARRLVLTGMPNYALTLGERAPGLVLPIVVTELLSPAANAAWYAAWMMAWVVFIVPVQVGMTLFAEIAHEPGSLAAATSRATRAALLVGVPAAVALALLAHPLLALLGNEYAETGVGPLRILVLGLIPLIFVQVYYASCRGVGRLGEAIIVAWASGLISICAAAVAGVGSGLEAMALAWVAAQLGAALFAAVRLGRLRRRHVTEQAGLDVPAGLATGAPAG
jgi:O-antigen/teichoic acid export membrane protein